MENKILFTTVHPAPYIDAIIEALSLEYRVTVLYNVGKNSYKQWRDYEGEVGRLFSDMPVASLAKLVLNNNFILVGGWASWDCIKLILLAKLFNRKVAVFSDCPRIPNKKSLKYLFKRYFLFPITDYLFCATDSTVRLYHEHYKVNITRLKFFPYAINFPNKNDVIQTNIIRLSQLQKGDFIRIFIANNFYERKGYRILLNAFKNLADCEILNRFQITIAGVGEDAEYYKSELSKLSSSIRFLGWLEVDDYYRYMNETDIYIHASLHEPFGIPPLDAMARGKLVIVSDGVQSTLSLIDNGKNGYVYPFSSAESLTRILKNIEIEKIYEIGENAQKMVNKKYTHKIFSETLNNCFLYGKII